MTTDKKIALVLGGTAPHIELINQLKGRGYYTILIDYFDNPPAKSVADEHLKESTLDYETVLKIGGERRADLVISACVDQANVTACYVGEKLGLPIPYSYQTALACSDKQIMKRIMLENDIPTAAFYSIDKVSDVDNLELRFPVMVKPANCCASTGVKKANSIEDVKKSVAAALELSRTGQALVEEFIIGKEISIYFYIDNKKARHLITSQRFSVLDGEKKVVRCFSSIAPVDLSDNVIYQMDTIAEKIALAFGLDNTPLFYQCIVDQNENVSIIEFAPRVAGGLSFRTILKHTGFDIISATIDSYLGIRPKVNLIYDDKYYLTHQINARPGMYNHVVKYREMIDRGIIDEIHFHKTKGFQIHDESASGGRIAAFISASDNIPEILNKAKIAISEMDVISATGDSMIRKDLYLKQCDLEGQLLTNENR